MKNEPFRDRSREPLVKIAVAENPATAELIRQILENAGIRCLIKNTDALGVIYGSGLTASYALQVFVLQGDETAALAALGDDRSGALPPPPLPPRRRYRKHPR